MTKDETWQEMMDRRGLALAERLRPYLIQVKHKPLTLVYLKENLFVDSSKKTS